MNMMKLKDELFIEAALARVIAQAIYDSVGEGDVLMAIEAAEGLRLEGLDTGNIDGTARVHVGLNPNGPQLGIVVTPSGGKPMQFCVRVSPAL